MIIIWFPDVDLFLYFLQPATCYINLCVASSNRGGSLGWHKTSSGCLLQCFSSHVVRALEHCGSDQNYFRLSGKYILIVNQNDVSWNTNRCCQAQVLWSLVFVHLPSKECSKVGIELSNRIKSWSDLFSSEMELLSQRYETSNPLKWDFINHKSKTDL